MRSNENTSAIHKKLNAPLWAQPYIKRWDDVEACGIDNYPNKMVIRARISLNNQTSPDWHVCSFGTLHGIARFWWKMTGTTLIFERKNIVTEASATKWQRCNAVRGAKRGDYATSMYDAKHQFDEKKPVVREPLDPAFMGLINRGPNAPPMFQFPPPPPNYDPKNWNK